MTAPPGAMGPPVGGDTDRGYTLAAVTAGTLLVAFILFFLRFGVRLRSVGPLGKKRAALGWDDLFLSLSLVSLIHIHDRVPDISFRFAVPT
jgi:hypothetical protein